MDADSSLKTVEETMAKAIEFYTQELSGIRTGKASPSLIENIDVKVASYGSTMKLKGLGVITTPEARQLLVQPFDPSTTRDIEKAIRDANLGFNPMVESTSVRVPVPELTAERRKDMVKTVKGMTEDAKVRIRGCRKDGMDTAKKLKNENILTEDSKKDFETSVQELTDKSIKQIDELFVTKEKEVLTV